MSLDSLNSLTLDSLPSVSGSLTAGVGGELSTALIPSISGDAFAEETPSATISGDPSGVSISFDPPYYLGAPPSGLFTMAVSVTPSAAPGDYTITVDDNLAPGGDCSGACIQPTFELMVEPAEDIVESVSINPGSGFVVPGVDGTFTSAVTATILGDVPTSAVIAYSISPEAQGISLTAVPSEGSGAPPTGAFAVTVSSATNVPSGVYTIRVGEGLGSGVSCYPVIPSPCAAIFTLTVYSAGATIPASLQDDVNVADHSSPSASAALSDVVQVADAYAAPAVASLSDLVSAADRYVAPVTAPLSDFVAVVDGYVKPVLAPLSDTIAVVEHLSSSLPAAAAAAGLGALGGAWGVFLVRRERKNRQRKEGS